MKDLLAAMTRGKSEEGEDKTAKSVLKDYNTMRVNTLRKLLHEKGLDVDGSREMMVARLEENDAAGEKAMMDFVMRKVV